MNKLLILTFALIIGAGFYRLLTDGQTPQPQTPKPQTPQPKPQPQPQPQPQTPPPQPKPQPQPQPKPQPQPQPQPKPQPQPQPQPKPQPQPQPQPHPQPQPKPSSICKAGFNPVLSTDWDSAFFVSGGTNNAYNISDIGKEENTLVPNCSNGADASCGASDEKTMNKCINTGKYKYNIKYAKAYNGLLKNNYCKAGSRVISLANPEEGGKVAVLEHGPFGVPLVNGPNCTTSHYDRTLNGSKEAYEARRNKLAALLKNCGNNDNPNTFVYTDKDDPSLKACLISESALNKAGIVGEVPISNGGVAIASGHGLGDGGCGAVFLVQQGKAPGTQAHDNPGNTIMLLQVGTRAWSGEISDTLDSTAGYLRKGSNTPTALSSSASCLQPRFRRVSNKELDDLFDIVCEKDDWCIIKVPPGSCKGSAICNNQSYNWCKAAGTATCEWK
jgi:hypothetical protein